MSVFQSHLYTRPRHTDTHTQKKLGNSCCWRTKYLSLERNFILFSLSIP
jgi:hypothetical protein